MDSLIIFKIKRYKRIFFQKPAIYLAILFSSVVVISILWINMSNEDNINITHDECTIPEHGADKCKYINDQCSNIKGLINYLSFIYCTMSKYECFAMIIMVLWIIWLFLLFGTSASSFFSPNLTVIANYLHLPESVAGVTLAALGNGAPDVFSTFSSFKVNSGGLAIGELVGASLFVSILVVGSISLVSPLKVSKKPFLCDMLFFIGAVFCVLNLLIKGSLSSVDSIVMLGYYVLYVATVVIINWRRHVKQSRIENYHSLGFHFPRYEFESDSEEIYNDDADIEDSSDFSDSSSYSNSNSLYNDNINSPNSSKSLIIANTRVLNNDEIVLSPPSLYNIPSNENNADEDDNNENENNEKLITFKEKIIIEMQVHYDKYFFNRCLYTVSKTFCNLYQKGDQFKNIGRVYSVNILYDNLVDPQKDIKDIDKLKFIESEIDDENNNAIEINENDNENTYSVYNIVNIKKKIVNKTMQFYFIELKKFNYDKINKENPKPKDLWAAFLKAIDYKVKKEGNKKIVEAINNLNFEILSLLNQVAEIREAILICKKTKINENRYGRYIDIIASEEILKMEIEKVNKVNKMLQEENKMLQEKSKRKEEENKRLREILGKHGISFEGEEILFEEGNKKRK